MDQILDAPVQENKRFEYAGFWIRTASFIIDYIIFLIIFWIGGFFAADLFSSGISNFYIFYFISLVAYVLYFTMMESSTHQATIGKMAVGIKVGDRLGNKISFANGLGRTFSKFVSALILYIGFMMAGWDDRKQALHDKIADTYVFYK